MHTFKSSSGEPNYELKIYITSDTYLIIILFFY